MALYHSNGRWPLLVDVLFSEKVERYIVYVLKISLGDVWWIAKHRYREFAELHDVLVSNHGLRKDLLPAKKILGNTEPNFVETRRQALDTYMKSVIRFLGQVLPPEVATFLQFQDYEIYSILQNLAREISSESEDRLDPEKPSLFMILHVYAISTRLQLPRSVMEQADIKQDFSHVVDFTANLKTLEIHGSSEFWKESNIVPNQLVYDLNAFKAVKELTIKYANLANIVGVRMQRKTVEKLAVHSCGAKRIADILLCDAWCKEPGSLTSTCWKRVETANFSENCIAAIDDSIASFLPKLKILNLSHNWLTDIANLSSLSFLTELNLANNRFAKLESWHTKLGNIVSLNLAQNHLRTLKGLEKLYCLVQLDVRYNQLATLEALAPVAQLPCLEQFTVLGNPVTSVVDYRLKTLSLFRSRAEELCLDNEKTQQQELDKIAVLNALQNSVAKISLKA